MVEFKDKNSKKEITVSDYPSGSKLIGEESESDELKIFIDEMLVKSWVECFSDKFI